MSKKSTFEDIFNALRDIMMQSAMELDCIRNSHGDYHLDTRHIMKNKKALFFGAVKINKNYVSFHLMPVYVFPELLQGLSPGLKCRMQGKSCFNFKKPDVELFKEIALLTKTSYLRYQEAGYV